MKFPSKYRVANLTGIPWFLNWLNRNKLLVLAYHGIYDGLKLPGAMPDTFVHISEMKAQLEEIKSRYHVIEPDQLLDAFERGTSLPPHSVLITFDDGYESFYRLAYPILQSLGIKSIVFVATQYVEDQRPFFFDLMWLFINRCSPERKEWLIKILGIEDKVMDPANQLKSILNEMKRMLPEPRNELADKIKAIVHSDIPDEKGTLELFKAMNHDQLRHIAESGTALGGHTHSHTIMSVMPTEVAESDVIENKSRLERMSGKQSYFFAYPNGGALDFREVHKRIIEKTGYIGAFTLMQSRCSLKEDRMELPRFHVAAEDGLESLLIRCALLTVESKRLLNVLRINE